MKNCLARKVFSTKTKDKEGFIRNMTIVWNLKGGMSIEIIRDNWVIIYFTNGEDKLRIVVEGPWHHEMLYCSN